MPTEATQCTYDSITIAELARDLDVSIRTIVQYASEGLTKLFYPTYPNEYSCLSIYKAPPKRKIKINSNDTTYTPSNNTFNVHAEKINGLLLSRQDCLDLLLEKRIHRTFFTAATIQQGHQLGFIYPMTGVWIDGECVSTDPTHWHIACYDEINHPRMNRKGKKTAPSFKIFDIQPRMLYASTFYADRLRQILKSPRHFLGDLIDGKNIRDDGGDYERPFSKKLIYLIEASEKFWSRAAPGNANDHAAKREKVREYLKRKEFASYFLHDEVSVGVLAAAEKFIEPVFARENAVEAEKSAASGMIESGQEVEQPGQEYLAPELITLLAAHKYFWRNPDVVAGEVPPPKREAIEPYLRAQGLSGNAVDYAMTLIRPENAAYGPPTAATPVEQASLRMFKNPNAGKREL